MTAVEDVEDVVYRDPRADLPRWRPTPYTDRPTLVVLPPMLVNILDSLCEGKNNRQIGADWGIAEDTVKTHLKRLYAKFGVNDRLQAVVQVLSGAIDVRLKPGAAGRDWSAGAELSDFL